MHLWMLPFTCVPRRKGTSGSRISCSITYVFCLELRNSLALVNVTLVSDFVVSEITRFGSYAHLKRGEKNPGLRVEMICMFLLVYFNVK